MAVGECHSRMVVGECHSRMAVGVCYSRMVVMMDDHVVCSRDDFILVS
jgi:hypothetical protein